MASEATIKAAIESHVTPSLPYSSWTIGVTDDPAQRRIQHGNPSVWYQWATDSETVGRNVESYFLNKGMKGGTGGGGKAGYVYIF